MKKILTLGVLLIYSICSNTYAQTCDCTRTISSSGIYNGQTMNIQPGEIICIQSGNYSLLRFINFIGTPSQPIIFKNCGGQVNISHNQYYGALDFLGSKYFKVSGRGSNGIQYGILISATGTNASGLSVAGLSTNCEIENVEIKNTGFAGMLIKTDPNCDSTTWRSNFIMKDISIHDNYVHNTGGEGLYVGSSFFNGKSISCNGQTKTVFPHLIENLKIYNNLIENTGADGIQYSCAPQANVYNNIVNNYGVSPFEEYQNNGIQLGASSGNCYGNTIESGTGNGIQITQPTGNVSVYNNIVKESGKNSLFGDDRNSGSVSFIIANNTFVKSTNETIKLYGNTSIKKIYNNVLAEPTSGTYLTYGLGASADEKNNFKTNSTSNLKFVSANNFHLTINSPAINAGLNLASYNIDNDFEGNPRPNGGNYDIGAFESLVNPPILSPIGNKSLSANTSLSFIVSANDPDGTTPTITATNLPTYTSFTDNGDGTGTFTATPQASNMTFDVTFTTSDATGGFSSVNVKIQLYASVPSSPRTMFRINAGGESLANNNGNFIEDTNLNPSSYSNVSAAGSVSGTSSVITNQTDLPNQVFLTFRRDSQAGDDMRWNFPVYFDASWYIVNLYFIESVSSANRVFNIIIEGNTVTSNFDIKANAGIKTALKKSYNIYVTDGNLNIQLQRILDNPLISAIEVISIGINSPNARISSSNELNNNDFSNFNETEDKVYAAESNNNPVELIVYPNPVQDVLYLKSNQIQSPINVTIINSKGSILWECNISDQNTQNAIPFAQFNSGTYEVIINSSKKRWVNKIIKI